MDCQRQRLQGINRIRLEFKANIDLSYHNGSFGINRIRLEFKVDTGFEIGINEIPY